MNTPWGSADFVDNIDEGIIQVSTPSHGGIGIRIDKAENDYEISDYAKNQAIKANGYYWFEEDCNWALAIIELETFDIFPHKFLQPAYDCAKRWHESYINSLEVL